MTDVGAHLLGRKPSPKDDRDYHLADFLPADPLDVLLAAVTKKFYSGALKDLLTAIVKRIEGSPAPSPSPTPAPIGDVVWGDSDGPLDQGKTNRCVGYGGAQWGNTLPVDDHFSNADGNDLYAECKIIDGEPGQQDGSTVRSVAKALQNRGRLKTYAFGTVEDGRAWVRTKGPVIVGSDWDNPMFTPDADGYVVPDASQVAGGHCYVWVGDLPSEDAVLCQNSWGEWALPGGRFKVKNADWSALIARNGELLAAVELP